jgi:hypothetical protein
MKFTTIYIIFISFILTVYVIIILRNNKKEKYLADYMDYKYCRCNGKNTNYNYNTSY